MYIFEDSNEKNSGEKCFQTDSRKIHHTAGNTHHIQKVRYWRINQSTFITARNEVGAR